MLSKTEIKAEDTFVSVSTGHLAMVKEVQPSGKNDVEPTIVYVSEHSGLGKLTESNFRQLFRKRREQKNG